MSQNFCTQCGSDFVEGARFCTTCGAPRLDASAATTAPSPPTSARRTAPPAASPGEPSALSRYAPLLVLLVIVILVLGTVFIGLLNPKKPTQIVQRQGVQGAQGTAPQAPGAMPQDHPPLTIPEQVKQAIGDLEKKAQENPEDVQTWTHLGEVLYRAGQIERDYFEGAKRAFGHLLEIDPVNLDALRGLGNIAFEQNATDVAIENYEKYLEQKPDDLSVRTDLGTMFLSSGEVEKAVRTYDAVLKQDPTFFQAQFNLAIAYRTAGQDEAALAALAKARDHAPDEETRNQIDELLGRAGTVSAEGGAAQGAPQAQAAGDFRTAIETVFRTHQILASKVQRFDWQDDTNLTAVLTGFPMSQMPPDMRNMFLSRMKERIAAAKQASGVSETVTIELVDFESGEAMDKIVE